VRPILIRRMNLFAIGILAFGVLLLYGVFSAVSPNAAYMVVETSPIALTTSPWRIGRL
jgi:hypothetical protein